MIATGRTASLVCALLTATACGEAQVGADAAAFLPATRSSAAAQRADADPRSEPTAAPDTTILSEGARLYRAQFCGTCHAFAAAGTTGIFGPPHDGMRAIAERRLLDPGYSGSATTPEAYVLESLTEPAAYRVPGYERTRFLMPAYTQLSSAELDVLVRLLLDSPLDGGTP